MIISKKNHHEICKYLFQEGVLYAKKDYNLEKHPLIDVPNLEVINLMQSFKSREYVRETFALMQYYWYLTNEGIEYLRTFLNLPSEIVPATLKKSVRPPSRPFGAAPPRDRPRGPPRFEGDRPRFGDRDGYCGGPRGAPGDFGGDKAGAPAEYQPNYRTLQDKKLKGQLAVREKLYGQSAKAAAKAEKWLMPSEEGYLETEGLEKPYRIKQESIIQEVDIISSRKPFDMILEELGPYTVEYTSNGRYMLLGGRKGHLAMIDMIHMNLIKEFQVRETVRDVASLQNEQFFAVAQKKYPYIYNRHGTEIHCLKEHGPPLKLQFLDKHFLLASINQFGQLHYQDASTGEIVASYRTGLGKTGVMRVNSYNAIIGLGHSGGKVTMWKPTSVKPLVTMLCHHGPVTAVAFHSGGHLMATAGVDRKIKLWDIRKFEVIWTYAGRAQTLDFSQKGLLAMGNGSQVHIWGDSQNNQDYGKYMSHSMVKGYQVGKVCFRPYEDVLGIGHSMGVSAILVPGAGEPNYDTWVANPYETTKQRREKEVHALLDKLQPETIMLDPSKIGTVKPPRRKEKPSRKDLEDEMEAVVKAAKSITFKNKTKGRNKPSKMARKKEEEVFRAKRPFLEQELMADELPVKKQRVAEASELPKSLQRFARKKAS